MFRSLCLAQARRIWFGPWGKIWGSPENKHARPCRYGGYKRLSSSPGSSRQAETSASFSSERQEQRGGELCPAGLPRPGLVPVRPRGHGGQAAHPSAPARPEGRVCAAEGVAFLPCSGPRRSTPGAGACTPAGPRPEPRSPHCGPPLTLVELRRCDGESGSSVSARSGGEDPEDPLCPPPGQCRPVGAPPVRISSQDLPLGSRPAFPLPLEPAPDGRPAWLTQCVPGRALCPPGLVPTSDSGLFLPPTRPPSRPASAHPLLSVLRSPGQWPATPPGRVPLSPFPAPPPIPTVTSCLLHRVLAGLSVGAAVAPSARSDGRAVGTPRWPLFSAPPPSQELCSSKSERSLSPNTTLIVHLKLVV